MANQRPFVEGEFAGAYQFLKWFKPHRNTLLHQHVVRQANDWVETYPSAYIAWKAKQRLGVEDA